MTEFSDVCPKCGHEVEDLDGFGMLCDLGPGGCGWCSHPNITDGQCGFCGRMMEDRPSMDTLSRMDTQDLVARLDDYDLPARMDRAEEQIADLEAKLAEARYSK